MKNAAVVVLSLMSLAVYAFSAESFVPLEKQAAAKTGADNLDPADKYQFQAFIDDSIEGDINNDGQKELVVFSHLDSDQTNIGKKSEFPLTLSVYRITKDGLRLLWTDGKSMRYKFLEVLDRGYEFNDIGEIEGIKGNILMIEQPRAEDGPGVYEILSWQDDKLVKVKVIGGFSGESVLFNGSIANMSLLNDKGGKKYEADLVPAGGSKKGKLIYPVVGTIRNGKFVVEEIFEAEYAEDSSDDEAGEDEQ